MSWIPCPSPCSISTAAAPGSDAQGSGTGWIWDTPGPRHGSKNLPARSLWVMSIIPCRLIHYSRVNPCAVAWKWNIKRDFYINIYPKVLLRLLARLKRKVLRKATLAHICQKGTGVLPGISKEWPTACLWIISRHFHSYLWLQQLKLLPSLSPGMFLGDPSVAWFSTVGGGPSTGGKPFTRALSIREQSWVPLLPSWFYPSSLQGKIEIFTNLLFKGAGEHRPISSSSQHALLII